MKRFLLPLSLLLLTAPVPADSPSSPPPMAADAESLFDGQSLDGWDGDSRLWSVRDGVIHGETTNEVPSKGNTFLIYQGPPVGNFDLRMQFRCNEVNNSGIIYRAFKVQPPKAKNGHQVGGYQYENRNEVDIPNVSGFHYDEAGTRGRLTTVGEVVTWTADGKRVDRDDLITQDEFRDLMKLGEFNEAAIIARGNRLEHYLNGRLICVLIDEHPDKAMASGTIALQLHGGKPMFTEFKDIRLKRFE